ncbi:hypothetical protein AO1008_11336 [Aspergillus oryzae 100-8]|uniref:FAD dependent oxidoreductase domain-containing protein n=1 Tax=Aspergillus oryzae (strain 3.042) TaxID=1160506 RepID=I7ZKI2_ASPO3|nr:hypothetical protein Ao3042_11516 [Aspergillus oryzae 3.042]KDE75088.1 hypothetical protein AO1008_11336 [Aspergillus oryzae 100-8]|eukprot:EIT72287.1 hypothetical protein Ao3042_11516 [Aspergillus oryzae 3.042]
MVQFLETVFPHHFEDIDFKRDVVYDWTGIQGFTKDGASIVGRPTKGSPGEYVSVGHNGEGMGRCFACATVATDAMLSYLKGTKSWTPPEWFPMSFARNLGSGDLYTVTICGSSSPLCFKRLCVDNSERLLIDIGS